MVTKELTALFLKQADQLTKELESYSHEDDLWKVPPGISNSAGNLCLHLIGNLKHYIGATLGNTGYVRNRELEFSAKNVARQQLLAELQEAAATVEEILPKLSEDDLEKEFPVDFAGKQTTCFYLLLFLGHFNYHLGQINYHRRLLAS